MCISASRLARIKIPTATPMLLGSNFSMVPSVILPEETGCQKTKMAAAETGSTYNSASRLDRNAILAATPMFSGSSNSMGLLRTLPDTSGSRKSKMAATETGSTYNSASRLDRNAVSTATPMFSGPSNPNLMIRILSDTRGTGQSNMAAAKPEVLFTGFGSRHLGFPTSVCVGQCSQ